MKKAGKVLAVVLAAAFAAILLCGCSKENLEKFEQGVKDGIQQGLASAAKADPATIEEMQGSVDGQTYINTAAGITITFPDDYAVLGYADIKDQFKNDIDSITAKVADPKAAEIQISQSVPRCFAIKKGGSDEKGYTGFSIIVGNMQKPLSQDILTFTELSTKVAKLMDKTMQYSKPAAVKIDGMDAAYSEVNYTDEYGTVLERVHFFYPRNYFISVTFVPRADSDLADMDKVIGSIKIDK